LSQDKEFGSEKMTGGKERTLKELTNEDMCCQPLCKQIPIAEGTSNSTQIRINPASANVSWPGWRKPTPHIIK